VLCEKGFKGIDVYEVDQHQRNHLISDLENISEIIAPVNQ
jgi:hypothetical protein